MSSESGNWCLIESDPGVFTELMKKFGVSGLECEEVIDLDYLNGTDNVLGLIFLFNIADMPADSDSANKNVVAPETLPDVFFAKQVIMNACATQAILNILFNISSESVQLGETLANLKEFTKDFDCNLRGLTISNSDEIRASHNSFSNGELYEIENYPKQTSKDLYHFIGYMPINGSLYELDGVQGGPICHGKIESGSHWIEQIKPVIRARMEACQGSHFNLMTMIPARLDQLKKELASIGRSPETESRVAELNQQIEREESKMRMYAVENIRRRHNYMPFIVEMLKILAEQGRLKDLTEKAKALAKERHEKQKQSSA